MEHHFNIDYAKEYGIVEAVLINHFQYWLAKNAANNINFFDGRFWTYNSIQAYAKLFPYLTTDKVRRAIEKLVTAGVLIKGNFNKKAMDRTTWYSLRDDMLPNWQQRQDDSAEMPNASGENAEPIPCNNTTGTIPFPNVDNFSRTNSTSKNISTPKKEKKGLDLSFVATEYIEAFGEWLNYKRSIGEMYKTQRGVVRAYKDLLDACNNNPANALAVVNHSIDREYKGIFPPKTQQAYGNSSNETTSLAKQFAANLKATGKLFG